MTNLTVNKVCLFLLFILNSFSLMSQDEVDVVVTNSWTAAFARAAGVTHLSQLAPSEMNHPPEYELLPSDIVEVMEADVLIFAGYEVMMETVFSRLGKEDDQTLQIRTGYSPVLVEKALSAIALKGGDPAVADAFITSYKEQINQARLTLGEAGLFGLPVVVHFHQVALAEALGFEVLGQFGPAPLQASQLAQLAELQPALIIDNGHNPQASPLVEITGVPSVLLRNFPGGKDQLNRDVPLGLMGMAAYNVTRILEIGTKVSEPSLH